MADTTTKGFPYPEGPDPVDVAGDIQALAEAIDDMPGVQSYTGAEIAALAVGEKWAGRVVWNSTTGKLQVSNGSTFSDVDTSVALSSSTPQTLGTAAAGTSSDASRADHRHAMPSASDVGAIGISLFANKGTIAAATAASTPAALSVGSNGQMLMADSSATAGLRYVDPPANRNMLINGAMNVHQRSTSTTSITADGYYTADRWLTLVSSMGTWTQTVENDAPTGSGFSKSLKMTCTTADAAPAAGDLVLMAHRIEGQDLRRTKSGTASAEQLTISFWVKSNVTGTYIVDLINSDAGNRQVAATYTVSASGTWERKTITFPADTVGGYDNDNTTGLNINIWLGAGSTYSGGTLNTSWASLNQANRAVGQTNLAAATNNYWQVTGAQLETGPVATPFEFEPFEATLRKCQRYYWRRSAIAQYDRFTTPAPANSTTAVDVPIVPPVPMRVAPTSVDYANVTTYDNANIGGATTITTSGNGTRELPVAVATTTGLTQYRPYYLMASTSAGYIGFSAEL